MKSLEIIPYHILNTIKKYSVFFIYVIINSLFILKYGEQYNTALLAGYSIVLAAGFYFYIKTELKASFYKFLFWAGACSFFLCSIYVNYKVDGLSLNVDRWSAMETGINALLNGKYPYNIPDHMGQESSNLPVLIILGLPFYLLFGSVGYLQSFSFLLFCYLLIKIFDNYKQRTAVLILLIFSPSYLWEIYVKSDLFSNFIIVTGFTYLIWNRFIKQKNMRVELVSVLTALLLLTRLSVVLPLIIILFKSYWHFSLKDKIVFTGIFILMTAGILYLFFHNAPNLEVILKHNPFMIQGGKQPLFLSILYIIIAMMLSFKVKSFYTILAAAGNLLFICVFINLIMDLSEYGYQNMITNSYFDLSFFNMSMPFVTIALGMGFLENKINLISR
ncbi:4-amino-4-deoxy-L-arabinose transferase-like glycosyltransferase [Chryseobacterium sp. H1D6B]|uniref:hypothetical protein n=1 Tax=Chryseobacterium sp. H1D6B TaxID=2940588 RepID=UPI0015CB78EA|nr:hypothetical protein [Chryseobacterium sp. H1D6B]MDH6252704.1 4-amino-4-deoxy-L-arabinose transferase-like glycosyltransferase [Chryseobacterium sp. H1D6B]